ncbi:MAG: DUF192 domain-containing protein [Candidatus Dormiibacterota bacterium]
MAVRAADGSVLAHDVTVADSFGSRLMGLMGREQLDPDEGLWLLPCNSVHMFFMRTPLDIAYLDRQQRVVRCVPEMREWRVKLLPVPHAHSALELAPGTLSRHGIKEGDQLQMEAAPAARVEAEPATAGTRSTASLSSNVRE